MFRREFMRHDCPGGLLEKLTTSTRVHWKHRIPTPSGEVQVIRRSDGTNDVFYVTTDHLGSTDAVTDAVGAILVRESFAAYGARRGSNWASSTAPDWVGIANTTRRGYTGHEQLDNVMLVHMNGRVYDPAIGRFLSADPYVKSLDASQDWNRYAYVTNSPLRHTDPTGYHKLGEGLQWRVVWVDGPGYTPDGTSQVFDTLSGWTGGPKLFHTPYLGPIALFMYEQQRQAGGGRNGGGEGGGGGGGGDGADKQPDNKDPRCTLELPDGSSVEKNVAKTLDQAWRAAVESSADDAKIFQAYGNWFANVFPGGKWDYKGQPGGSEQIGNFNYGATGDVLFGADILLRAAGGVQLITRPSASDGGHPFGASPYGDQYADQDDILDGIKEGCK